MVDKYERTKRIVIIGYLFIVTLVMWGVSKTDMATFSEVAFFRFSMFFWGGGFAFHYLNVLLGIPASEHNWDHWKDLSLRILLTMLTIGGTLLLMLLSAKLVSSCQWPAWLYFVAGIVLFGAGIWISIAQAVAFSRKLNELQPKI